MQIQHHIFMIISVHPLLVFQVLQQVHHHHHHHHHFLALLFLIIRIIDLQVLVTTTPVLPTVILLDIQTQRKQLRFQFIMFHLGHHLHHHHHHHYMHLLRHHFWMELLLRWTNITQLLHLPGELVLLLLLLSSTGENISEICVQ